MKRVIILYICVILGAWSCSKRSMDIDGGDQKKYPVRFASAGFTSQSSPKQNGQSFKEGDVIGIYAYPWNESMFGSGEFVRKNVPYVQQKDRNLEVESGENPIYFPADPTSEMTFKGYFPFSEQISVNGVLDFDIADQRKGAASAILYSNNAERIQRTAEFVELKFGYVMAQVIVNIKYDPLLLPNESISDITEVSLSGLGVATACQFHIEDGSVGAKSGAGPTVGVIQLKPGEARTVATVMPGVLVKPFISVKTPSDTYVGRGSDITYKPGFQYTYNMTLKGGGVADLSSAIIEDWIPGNNGGEDLPVEIE